MTRVSSQRWARRGGAALAVIACGALWVASCKTAGPRGEGASSPASSASPESSAVGVASASASASGPTSAPAGSAADDPGAPSACERAADPVECYLERAVLIEGLIGDLYELEGSRDVRAIPAALDALDTGILDVQLVALDVLGPFASHEGVGAKVLPWLLADDPRREARAAEVLRRSADAGLERVARQYQDGHHGDEAAPELAGWWRDPAAHGLASYAGAKRFPPGDSRRAIGLVSEDSVEKVLAFYGAGVRLAPLDMKGFIARRNQGVALANAKLEAAYRNPIFAARQKELDDLIKEYERTRDNKIIAKISQLKPLPPPAPFDGAGALLMPLPPLDDKGPMKDAKWLVLEEREEVPARAIAVYREPAVNRTVIVLGWNPAVYAGAADPRTVRLR